MVILFYLRIAILIFLLPFAVISQPARKFTPPIGDQVTINVNNIALRIQNNGRTGLNGTSYYPAGSNNTFLFNGGIAITGKVGGEIRSASHIQRPRILRGLRAGRYDDLPTDSIARFYAVTLEDDFGSANYIRWSDAVATGAAYQDLNNDGQYDPFIDRPDLLGDYTYWCVYSDDTPMSWRTTVLGVKPIGVDIRQTVWAYERNDAAGDILFFRYELESRSDTPVDSMLFSVWIDPDIGYWDDDMIGSSIDRQTVFVYNDGIDAVYGNNPPAFGARLLQGPITNAPGEIAYNYRGEFFGTDILQNKRNVALAKVIFNRIDTPIIPIPFFARNFRWFQEGCLSLVGTYIPPSTYGTGATADTDCRFLFNGDPVTGIGWLDDLAYDKHVFANTGYFKLGVGETQTIIIAYLVGRGTDALDSITEMHARGDLAESILGFSNYPVGVEPEEPVAIENFTLLQNYPNPFNPSTTIRYHLPGAGKIVLDVYNLNGQKVAELINGIQESGEQAVMFDAKELPSGVYFYRLKVGQQTTTRKMLLVR